jgi:hypothetical protein
MIGNRRSIYVCMYVDLFRVSCLLLYITFEANDKFLWNLVALLEATYLMKSHYTKYFASLSLSCCSHYWSLGNPWNTSFNFSFLILRQSTGWGISLLQGHCLHRKTQAQTDIHALSGIQTHDPSVWVTEDSSCLKPRDHCDLHRKYYNVLYQIVKEVIPMITLALN